MDLGRLDGVFDGVVDEVVHHVGDVELVGKEYAVDGVEVGGDGAVAVFNGDEKTLDGFLNDAVQVNLFRGDGEFFARHLGTLQKSFDEDTHSAVFVADDVDEIASGGEVAGDGFVFEHLAGETDGGEGSLDFVGHVVDEVGLHFIEFVLGQDGTDGEDKECRDENNHADADDGVEVGVAAEDDGRGRERKDDVKAFVGGDAMGVEGVFES